MNRRKNRNHKPVIFKNPLIPQEALDIDALQVVRRLKANGFEAYLVGGCVRDLLLRQTPKDFDIATAARPRQIKNLFRNCRIIGRRFKLAHLHYGNHKILEVSTFRRTPFAGAPKEEDDLLIKQDNEFGTAEEDARRRDFTVNGLFYDPDHHEVLDWVGGLDDLKKRQIRTINDPITRFREDPVRILRAIKFAVRLGLQIETRTWQAMLKTSGDLAKSAPPRILEEIFRFLRSKNSLTVFQMLRETGTLAVIMPAIDTWLARAATTDKEIFWRHLEALDAVLTTQPGEVEASFILGSLFIHPIECMLAGGKDISTATEEIIGTFAQWSRLSRRDRARTKRICGTQHRFTETKRRFRVKGFVLQDYFNEALDLFHIRCLATGKGWDDYSRWRTRKEEVLGESHPAAIPAPALVSRETKPPRQGPKTKEAPAKRKSPKARTPRKTRDEKPGKANREAPVAKQPAADKKAPPKPKEKKSERGKRSRTGKFDPKTTMCPETSRCVIPSCEDRDFRLPDKVEPEPK